MTDNVMRRSCSTTVEGTICSLGVIDSNPDGFWGFLSISQSDFYKGCNMLHSFGEPSSMNSELYDSATGINTLLYRTEMQSVPLVMT